MIIVVTGGIGSGKSSFCDILNQRYGIPVYEADSKVKELYVSHPTLLESLESELDTCLRDEDGGFVPSRLGKVIFSDPVALSKVESLVFPALMEDFKTWMKMNGNDDRPVVFESATILEKDFFAGFADMVVLVNAPVQVRRDRAAERDGVSADAKIASQPLMNSLSEGFSDGRIDYVIDNSGSLSDLLFQVDDFMKNLTYNTNVIHKEHKC